jgi:hypothetical protein
LAKNLRKGDSKYESNKSILGFDLKSVNKTIWLEEDKRAGLLTILHQWIRGATRAKRGVLFAEFESITASSDMLLRHCRKGAAFQAHSIG